LGRSDEFFWREFGWRVHLVERPPALIPETVLGDTAAKAGEPEGIALAGAKGLAAEGPRSQTQAGGRPGDGSVIDRCLRVDRWIG
jgi:hypothetical protein